MQLYQCVADVSCSSWPQPLLRRFRGVFSHQQARCYSGHTRSHRLFQRHLHPHLHELRQNTRPELVRLLLPETRNRTRRSHARHRGLIARRLGQLQYSTTLSSMQGLVWKFSSLQWAQDWTWPVNTLGRERAVPWSIPALLGDEVLVQVPKAHLRCCRMVQSQGLMLRLTA